MKATRKLRLRDLRQSATISKICKAFTSTENILWEENMSKSRPRRFLLIRAHNKTSEIQVNQSIEASMK